MDDDPHPNMRTIPTRFGSIAACHNWNILPGLINFKKVREGRELGYEMGKREKKKGRVVLQTVGGLALCTVMLSVSGTKVLLRKSENP